jgi:hypothetical protein
MRHDAIFRSFFVVLCAAALAGSPGCSSGPDAASTADSMGKFGVETAKVNDGIEQALAALEKLVGTQGDDLRSPFEAYSKSVTGLEEQAGVVRNLAEEMKTRGDAFFKEWETDETSEVSPERRAKLSGSYAAIKESMIGAGEAFKPFLASLKDIQSYLKLDLTRKGLGSVSQLDAAARKQGADVKSLMAKVIQEVNSVRGMLSTKPSS